LAEDLRRYLADQPILARRASLRERAWRWCRRNPRPASLTAAAGLLALIAGVSLAVNGLLSGRVQVAEQQEQTAKELAHDADVKRQEEERAAREERFQALVTGAFSAERTEALRAIDEACGLLPHVAAGEAQRLQLRNACIAALCRAELRVAVKIPHLGGVAVFTAALDRFARTDKQGRIRICAVASEQELVHFPGPTGPAWAACTMVFSPDGRYLTAEYPDPNHPPNAEGPAPNQFHLWDGQHPKEPLLSARNVRGRPGFCPNSRWLAIPGLEAVELHELGSPAPGGRVRELKTQKREGESKWDSSVVAFHPHAPRLAVSRERGLVEVLDLAEPASADSVVLDASSVAGGSSEGTGYVRSLAWSADGALLAVAGRNGLVHLWQPAAKKLLGVLRGHTGEIREVAFSPNGRLLASKSIDGSARLWDVVGRRQLAAWRPNEHIGCASLAFSADGQRLRLGFGWDKQHLCLWDVAIGGELQAFLATEAVIPGVPSVGFSPDGRLLAIVDRSQAQLWDWASGTLRGAVPIQRSWAFHFGAEGQELLLSNRQGVLRWRFGERGVAGASLETLWKDSPLFQASYRPHDSKLLVRTGNVQSGPALLLDLDQRCEVLRIPEEAHPGLRFVALCPHQPWMATGTIHGQDVRIHTLPSGEPRHTLGIPSRADVQFSPDGRWLVICTGREVQFRKTGTWSLDHTLEAQVGDVPVVVSLSADSALIAQQFSVTKMRLFGAAGRYLAEIALPPGETLSWLSLSGDGQRLAAGCLGTHVYLWDLTLIRKQLRERGLDW
jgi:WD40 repeat protein